LRFRPAHPQEIVTGCVDAAKYFIGEDRLQDGIGSCSHCNLQAISRMSIIDLAVAKAGRLDEKVLFISVKSHGRIWRNLASSKELAVWQKRANPELFRANSQPGKFLVA